MPLRPFINRTRLKWAAITTAVAAAIGAVGAYYATRPAFLAKVIVPIAAKSIGGDVTVGRIAMGSLNSVTVEDLRVRVADWPGLSGEVLHADRIEFHFSLLPLLVGRFELTSVTADLIELRLVERQETPGAFSVFALKPVESEGGGLPQRPEVVVKDLRLLNGVLTTEDAQPVYRQLGELHFSGSMGPSDLSDTAFNFSLRGRQDSSGTLAVGSIFGMFDIESKAIIVTCDELRIEGKELPVAPLAVRRWAQPLDVKGRIAQLRFEHQPGSEPYAAIDLRGASMDLPVDRLSGGALENTWGGFANGRAVDLVDTPRMKLNSGMLTLARNEIKFESVEGEIGSSEADSRVIALPFRGSFSLRIPTESLPPFNWAEREKWLERAAAIAPFAIDIEIPTFSSPQPSEGAPDTLQLPRAATQLLSDFNITSWSIDIKTSVKRDPPRSDGTAGELHSRGQLVLSGGTGAYKEFDYPLENVTGLITYEDDNLAIDHIDAVGSDGAKVWIGGKLLGLSSGAEIDIAIKCEKAPIDDRLFEAFEEAPRDALRLLFDERAATKLGEAGLLPDEALLIEQRKERSRLPDDEAGRKTHARLTRSIDAGPFRLLGDCGFAMRVYSEAGWGKPVEVTGEVNVLNAGLVFSRFPYPLRLPKGTFFVHDESIEISPDGLTAITPAGGQLTVSGKVEIPRLPGGGRDSRLSFHLRDIDDSVNATLLAAIPDDQDKVHIDWPGEKLSPAGSLLSALGLSGGVQIDGRIWTELDAKGLSAGERFDFGIAFDNGRAAPNDKGRAELDGLGLPWPRDFTLEECSARLQLTPERVTISDCSGRAGDGTVKASGFAELESPRKEVRIEFDSVPIGRAFENSFASDPAESARQYERYRPTGTIDGFVERVVDEKGARTTGAIQPDFIELTLDGARVTGRRIAGVVNVGDDGLRADSLEFRLSEGTEDDGLLLLGGLLNGGAFEAKLIGTRIESALVRDLLQTRAAGVLDLLRSRAARGRFNATYSGGDKERYEIVPRVLEIGQPDERVQIAFGDDARIAGGSERVDFQLGGSLGLPGATDHRGTITVKGAYQPGIENRLDAALRIVDSNLTPALRKQLPPPLDTATESLNIVTTRSFELDLPDISLRWPESGSAEKPDIYQLIGSARLSGAAFDAGPRFSEIDADIPLNFRYEPAKPDAIVLDASIVATGGRVWDRPFGATKASIRTPKGSSGSKNSNGLVITGSGDVAYGRFDLDASVDYDRDEFRARVRIADADYDLIRSGTPAGPDAERSASRLTAIVDVGGPTGGSADLRTGSGRIAIRKARLASMPVAVRALQLTQLMLPTSSDISATTAEFDIRGNTAFVRACKLTAGTIELEGTGTVDISTFALGLRMFARGTVPIVSDVIGGVTGAIFAIDLTGTLMEPKAALAPLPGITNAPTTPQPANSSQAVVEEPRQQAPETEKKP